MAAEIRMKNIFIATTAIALLFSFTSLRAEADRNTNVQLAQYGRPGPDRDDSRIRFSRGDTLPRQLQSDRYVYDGWRANNLSRPPHGYRWLLVEDQFILASVSTGRIAEVRSLEDHGGFNRRRGRPWISGDMLPQEYWHDRYVYRAWRDARLPPPIPGYRWLLIGDEFVLASPRTGHIARIIVAPPYYGPVGPRPDRMELWQRRYQRAYSIQDDPFYRECRNRPDPAGALAGAVLGGILGNVAGNRRNETTTTVAGVIAGGALGAALTNKLQCEDRSYAYKTYINGFNAGRPGANYDWQNPQTGTRGRLHILDYYEDEDNFRCSVYTQTVYIGGRAEEARGRACQQPDGAWLMID